MKKISVLLSTLDRTQKGKNGIDRSGLKVRVNVIERSILIGGEVTIRIPGKNAHHTKINNIFFFQRSFLKSATGF